MVRHPTGSGDFLGSKSYKKVFDVEPKTQSAFLAFQCVMLGQ
jgi:hypothetical protein